MRKTVGFVLAAIVIASTASGAVAAPRQTHHTYHRMSADRPGTVLAVPYGARNAFGAVPAPTIGEGCDLRPFARDCDKRGPW